MPDVAKHDSEQEGENGDGEEGRVDLLVTWNTVSVDDLLEGSSELVDLEVCRRLRVGLRLTHSDDWRH